MKEQAQQQPRMGKNDNGITRHEVLQDMIKAA
jgi:hypothetical protein